MSDNKDPRATAAQSLEARQARIDAMVAYNKRMTRLKRMLDARIVTVGDKNATPSPDEFPPIPEDYNDGLEGNDENS